MEHATRKKLWQNKIPEPVLRGIQSSVIYNHYSSTSENSEKKYESKQELLHRVASTSGSFFTGGAGTLLLPPLKREDTLSMAELSWPIFSFKVCLVLCLPEIAKHNYNSCPACSNTRRDFYYKVNGSLITSNPSS